MTNQDLETLVATLKTMMDKAMNNLQMGIEELAEGNHLPPDITDRASMESDRNFALLMRERDRKTLADIREALSKLDSGEYGTCEDCGEDIGLARLRAHPMATQCVSCKTRQEDEQRQRSLGVSSFF